MHGSWRGGVSEPINIDNVKTLFQTARSALHWCNMILQVYIFGSMALEYKEYFTHIVLWRILKSSEDIQVFGKFKTGRFSTTINFIKAIQDKFKTGRFPTTI